MKNRLFAAVGVAALLLAATPASAVLIDFDTLPGGGTVANNTIITSQYSTVGATFSQFENGGLVSGPLATTQFAPAGQMGNRLGNFFGVPYSNRADILRIDFSGPASNIVFDFMPQGGSGADITVNAFDSMGGLLSSVMTGIGGFPVIAPFNVPINGVSRLEILQPTDDWNWGMDNLSFDLGPVAIPEPGTLALFGLGLAGLSFARRRKVAA